MIVIDPWTQERFWDHVIKREHSACWTWCGFLNSNGYGIIKNRLRKTVLAHRYAYEVSKGEIPAGYCVLHKCDVPSCVNPGHLFLGTQSDNMRDLVAKGRGNYTNAKRGVECSSAKINEDTVRQIRELYGLLQNKSHVANALGLKRSCVRFVVEGRTWKHVR